VVDDSGCDPQRNRVQRLAPASGAPRADFTSAAVT
jgi:hypothetical protein